MDPEGTEAEVERTLLFDIARTLAAAMKIPAVASSLEAVEQIENVLTVIDGFDGLKAQAKVKAMAQQGDATPETTQESRRGLRQSRLVESELSESDRRLLADVEQAHQEIRADQEAARHATGLRRSQLLARIDTSLKFAQKRLDELAPAFATDEVRYHSPWMESPSRFTVPSFGSLHGDTDFGFAPPSSEHVQRFTRSLR